MFTLTRQEQLMVVFVMLALAVGTLVRVYRQNHPPFAADTRPGLASDHSFHE